MSPSTGNGWLAARIFFLRLRFVLVFAVIWVLVANWDRITAVVDRFTRPAKAPDRVEGDVEWFCSMHPSVVRKEPGNCPICGMPLSRRKKAEKQVLPDGVLSRLQLSPHRIRQAGLASVEVKPRVLVREIRTVGSIDFDERRVARISARVAGRADELFVNFTWVRVKKGDPVYSLYSPDLVATQEEYLIALKNVDALSALKPTDEAAVAGARRTADSARERLRLWGITDQQVAALEKARKTETHLTIHSPIGGTVIEKNVQAGQYLQVGENAFTVADDSVVWMQAEVFERDIGLVQEGQLVEIRHEAFAGDLFLGRVGFIEPRVNERTRTVKVRVDVENPKGRLKPGMYASAALRIPLGGAASGHYCCADHPDVRRDQPGMCSKCERILVPEAGDGGAPPAAPPSFIFECIMNGMKDGGTRDTPGPCPVCGMTLGEEHRVARPASAPPAGEKTAPPAGEKPAPAPGGIPAGGETWRCPLHPLTTAEGKLLCPECGVEMRPIPVPEVLAVPLDSVIDTGTRRIVFLDRKDGVYEAVEVVLGPKAGEFFQVLKGLSAGDRVVTSGAFLLDSEARLNPAAGAQYFGASGKP